MLVCLYTVQWRELRQQRSAVYESAEVDGGCHTTLGVAGGWHPTAEVDAAR